MQQIYKLQDQAVKIGQEWSQQCLSQAAMWPLPQKDVYHDYANYFGYCSITPSSTVAEATNRNNKNDELPLPPSLSNVNNHGFQTKYNLLKEEFLMHIKDEKEAVVLIMSVDLLDVSYETLVSSKIFIWMKERKDTVKHAI